MSEIESRVVWALGLDPKPASVQEVTDTINVLDGMFYRESTVRSVLARLHASGIVRRWSRRGPTGRRCRAYQLKHPAAAVRKAAK